MPLPKEMEDLNKQLGLDTPEAKKAAEETEGGGNDWVSKYGLQSDIGEGVGHGLSLLAVDTGRLLENVVPEGFSKAVQNLPGAERLTKYADSPYQSYAEQGGSWLTQGIATMMGPGRLRTGKLALDAVEKYFPQAARARWVGRTAPGNVQGWTDSPLYAAAKKWGERGGNAAEMAGRGAIGGAIADPEDPGTGAITGAASPFGGPIAGRMLRSPIGQFFGRHMLGTAAGAGIAEAARHGFIPWSVAIGMLFPAVHWYQSPLGRRLRRVGQYITDEVGRVIGRVGTNEEIRMAGRARGGRPVPIRTRVPPETTGYAGGSAADALAGGTNEHGEDDPYYTNSK